jgi:putative chitinase
MTMTQAPSGQAGVHTESGDARDVDRAAEESQPEAGTEALSTTQYTHQAIARDGLNLRSGPDTKFPAIGNLPLGTAVNIISRDGDWALVDQQGDGAGDGYVFAKFLEERKSLSGAPPAWSANKADDFIPIDKALLQIIMDRCAKIHIKSKLDLGVVADALNRSMKLADATNRRREVGFLSQAVIETDYFRTFHEYGSGAGKSYAPYYGRGIHQLTWKNTYAACSKALFQDDRLVKTPNLILDDIDVNVKATAWFWRDYKPFNALADAENVDEIIHRLYGGTIASPNPKVRKSVILRRGYYQTIKIALNERADGKI